VGPSTIFRPSSDEFISAAASELNNIVRASSIPVQRWSTTSAAYSGIVALREFAPNPYLGGEKMRVRKQSARLVLLVAIGLTMSVAPTVNAAAVGPGIADEPDNGLVYDGLERNRALCEAGFLVSGTRMCTPGPDPAPPGVNVHENVPLDATPHMKLAGCKGDDDSGLRTEVLYVRASDRPDRFALSEASLRHWAEAAGSIFVASANETGGYRFVRFLRDAACNLVMTPVVLSPTGDDTFSNTITELAALGYNRTDRKYMIFADANVYCGIGTIKWDDQPGPDNANNSGPSYGRTDAGCWNGDHAAHELMHNLGGVQLSAPHSSGGGHCVDEWDRMCYSDSPNYPPMQYLCADSLHDRMFDCNHDDYYSTNPPSGSYLRTHWNAANSLYLYGGTNWGYVLADQPAAASYTPTNQRNPSKASNTVTRSAVGIYTIHFPNLPAIPQTKGTVNVTAYGPNTDMCKVGSFAQSGTGQLVEVRCFTSAGVPVDTEYAVGFTAVRQPPGEMGYVYAEKPLAASYAPWSDYRFNSTDITNLVKRNGTGDYTVSMPGLGVAPAGHVKVTAFGTDANNCKVGNTWQENAGERRINVRCFTAAGDPANTPYTVTYVNNVGVLAIPGADSAYVAADQPSAASYTPALQYQFNSTGATNTITRSATGTYKVHLPGLAANNGDIQVTGYGSDPNRCKVTGRGTTGSELTVDILCLTPAGDPVDTNYTASFTR
jgi:hypothetical protein